MKIIYYNRKTATIKLRTETPEDPWHLEKVLEKGDIITAKTARRKTIKRGNEIVRAERVAMDITISLEKWAMEAGSLRLTGTIVAASKEVDKASHHSIHVTPNMIVLVKKYRWRRDQLDRLERAGASEPLLFICVLDRESAHFGSLQESGLENRGEIIAERVLGREDDRTEYYSRVAAVLDKEAGSHNTIIIAGPGFEKENLFKYVNEKHPKISRKISVETANSTGSTGMHEVIKTSVNRVLKQTRIARETGLVERLLEYIGSDGLATYGQEHVRIAAMHGAVKTLLVSEEMVPDNEGMMDAVENMGGEVFIISSSHEAGERFLYLGGIAAMLRYKP